MKEHPYTKQKLSRPVTQVKLTSSILCLSGTGLYWPHRLRELIFVSESCVFNLG
jgi:hypothetical protein